jgi:hypothetical protein
VQLCLPPTNHHKYRIWQEEIIVSITNHLQAFRMVYYTRQISNINTGSPRYSTQLLTRHLQLCPPPLPFSLSTSEMACILYYLRIKFYSDSVKIDPAVERWQDMVSRNNSLPSLHLAINPICFHTDFIFHFHSSLL